MDIRNKKTGEITYFDLYVYGHGTYFSISEFMEEWEEIKESEEDS